MVTFTISPYVWFWGFYLILVLQLRRLEKGNERIRRRIATAKLTGQPLTFAVHSSVSLHSYTSFDAHEEIRKYMDTDAE